MRPSGAKAVTMERPSVIMACEIESMGDLKRAAQATGIPVWAALCMILLPLLIVVAFSLGR